MDDISIKPDVSASVPTLSSAPSDDAGGCCGCLVIIIIFLFGILVLI